MLDVVAGQAADWSVMRSDESAFRRGPRAVHRADNIIAVGRSWCESRWQSGLIDEGQRDSIDDDHARIGDYRAEASFTGNCGKLGDARIHSRDAYSTNQNALLEQRNAAGID